MLIIATSGIYATTTKKNNVRIILSGADIIRLNYYRRTPEENIKLMVDIKKSIDDLNAGTKIMVDLPLEKYRLGDFEEKSIDVKEHEEFICRTASYSSDCREFIPMQVADIGKKVRPGQIVSIGDGEVAVQVIDIIDDETITIKILNTGPIVYRSTFNIPFEEAHKQSLEKYEEIIAALAPYQPDYIAIPYLSAEKNEKLKALAIWKTTNLSRTKLIIRIENEAAIKNGNAIFSDSAYDMALFDRGEMAVNTAFEQTGVIQNKLLALSNKYNKPLLVSTQILESTANNYVPARAEISDLTNLALNGVHGIIFGKETGFNSRPAYTIATARKIINAAAKHLESQ